MNCLPNWKCLTTDPTVLSYVEGYEIEFEQCPVQFQIPREYKQNSHQKSILQVQIDELKSRGVINEVNYSTDLFVSSIFGREKPNGDIRMIIDLSDLNEYVRKIHFKMDHSEVALDMLEKDMFMTSFDLKDAYYSVPIWQNHKKYLCFQWENAIYQFQVLPFGLSSAPRVFTKILKPIFSKMREEGFSVLGYIDDSLIMANSFQECVQATQRLSEILTSLGFTINLQKSSLIPSKKITFLGYEFDSTSMTVQPTEKKRAKLLDLTTKLLSKKVHKIRFVASAIGFIVDLGKGIEYGANYFRYLERDKICALRRVRKKGYNGLMFLSKEAKDELKWWSHNIKFRSKIIRTSLPTKTLTTDASMTGWGAISDNEQTGGTWSSYECESHINVLEMKAVLLGLQSFFSDHKNIEILVKSDNTTTVSYINRLGGSKSSECEILTKKIWQFCESRDMWIMATHIPGVDNEAADFMSRHFTDNTEWTLNPHIFDLICEKWGYPNVDLFASRLNHKVQTYVSWMKDPHAIGANAFSMDWDDWKLIYMFPPFSLIAKCLRRIKSTKATVILVVPNWPGQI